MEGALAGNRVRALTLSLANVEHEGIGTAGVDDSPVQIVS
jgi:hypothetical protein